MHGGEDGIEQKLFYLFLEQDGALCIGLTAAGRPEIRAGPGSWRKIRSISRLLFCCFVDKK